LITACAMVRRMVWFVVAINVSLGGVGVTG
jgi:hypothetical protein